MTARFYADLALVTGTSLTLPDTTARHVQVLRLQPGDAITLFNGHGDGRPNSEGEFEATITRMGRSDVDVTVGAYTATTREAARAVHLAIGMPANERMDWLVEKATELGAASIQPLMTERSVLRLKSERADKKRLHWRSIATAACEQCGRNRLPVMHEVRSIGDWLKDLSQQGATGTGESRLLLSLEPGTQPLAGALPPLGALTFLSGPEGGLNPQEDKAARAQGFHPVTLGSRVLRSETAPLACLAYLSLLPHH